jgi:hypothetical protein
MRMFVHIKNATELYEAWYNKGRPQNTMQTTKIVIGDRIGNKGMFPFPFKNRRQLEKPVHIKFVGSLKINRLKLNFLKQ